MKHSLLLLTISAATILSGTSIFGQTPKGVKYTYTEASDLTITGKLMPGKTTNPYHRVDTVKYKGFTPTENFQVRMTSGMACAFKTNTTSISILTEYGQVSFPTNTNGFSARGYDLYIKQDGRWLYAASGVAADNKMDKPFTLINNMDGTEHECLLYFPLYSEEYSIKIGVDEGKSIAPIENPFRHRIAIWGSSYTHGSSTTRSGMSYPAQFSRATGLQMLSLGCSGRCLLQDYFCDVLCDVEADAFVFDSFSNPTADLIKERLVPFIDRMVAAHPGTPLIFQQTIYRERRNFNVYEETKEQAKMDMAASIFKELKSTREGREKYKDVYFIVPDAVGDNRNATVDGVHPDNYGYTLWAESIRKPIVRILKKYGIR
ncbi:MAG: SGNH/GDSL hydrolase family protein [Bacteroidales bacterium]|nr:SGNH/GDSL hydrolase family protein [Bacteroidales bacterium]